MAGLADFFFVVGLGEENIDFSPFSENLTLSNCSSGKELNRNPTISAESKSQSATEPPSAYQKSRQISSIKDNLNHGDQKDLAVPTPQLMVLNREHLKPHLKFGAQTTFEDALTSFMSNRDSFLSALEPPAASGRRIEEVEGNDQVSPIRSKSSIRKRSYLGRATSLNRNSTIRGSSVSRSSTIRKRDSIRELKRISSYNAVTPAPEPLILPPGTHPLKRKFAPALLSRWPSGDQEAFYSPRESFPDYFVFPDDIQIKLADSRPRSTWHSFTLTDEKGDRIHGTCVIIWIPLGVSKAEELEYRCSQWRQAHMSHEEREMAESFTSKLAAERTNLSALLTKLPSTEAESQEREDLEDLISQCEERINLFSELLGPIRIGACAKVEGLTEGSEGVWIPRAYGLLGREGSLQTLWREYLRALCAPMLHGEISRIPFLQSIGQCLPIERFVVNILGEISSPTPGTQIEIIVRDLKLYATKNSINEYPDWRDVDIYPIFRALSIKSIVTLFESALAEARIIFLSTFPAMLHAAARTLVHLLYPLIWRGVYIPVLPSRLLSCLEAPCSYIIGIDRRYTRFEPPEEDFVLCDLDSDSVICSQAPPSLPPSIKGKLTHLLNLGAPLHIQCGVPTGPPAYIRETYPTDTFWGDRSVISKHREDSLVGKLVATNSSTYHDFSGLSHCPPIFNAYTCVKEEASLSSRPGTSARNNSSPLYRLAPLTSVSNGNFSISNFPSASRNFSTSNLCDTQSRNRSFSLNRRNSNISRRHTPVKSIGSVSDKASTFHYAPTISGQSISFAPSTIFNFDSFASAQPVAEETEITKLREGHCLRMKHGDLEFFSRTCDYCDDMCEDGMFECQDCSLLVHGRCLEHIYLPCTGSFSPDHIRVAFLRTFATLFRNYRRCLDPVPPACPKSKDDPIYTFRTEAFLRSNSSSKENNDYLSMLMQTQAFSEFIHDRCRKPPDESEILFFDEVIAAKKNREKLSLFAKSEIKFLSNLKLGRVSKTVRAIPPNRENYEISPNHIGRIPQILTPHFALPPRTSATKATEGCANRVKRKAVLSVFSPTLTTLK
ncbi:DENN domain-containing protein [Neolecta irregularis DAH-3]|uniref:DENN domain-containing protein n=1 Tax=Neolecta irregularis (strain DAH-3) TaxID=1198029 RepID=A0A1U7LJV7_NEOID|nr:DENN domain-containing protein [Neolecta irregularis DAH-3]|eukprot:OLL22940.1 DENN domain-containing protein [Neolecta irregularis DAH-3]